MEQGRGQSVVLSVRIGLATLLEDMNNAFQPIPICHNLLEHAELLKDGRGFNYHARDRPAKHHYWERDKTSSRTFRHPTTLLHPFLPSLW